MAPESVIDARRPAAGQLVKAQAILNLLMVARDVEPRAASNAAWAATDLIEEVLFASQDQVKDGEMAANCLWKAEALIKVLMAAKDPAEHLTRNVSWAIGDLIKAAREAGSNAGAPA